MSADTERDDLALAIVNSEAFMWLMVGANHQESWLSVLRPAYKKFTALGGGWGKKLPQRNDGFRETVVSPEMFDWLMSDDEDEKQ